MNSLVETKTEIDNFVIEYETVLVNESDNYLEWKPYQFDDKIASIDAKLNERSWLFNNITKR